MQQHQKHLEDSCQRQGASQNKQEQEEEQAPPRSPLILQQDNEKWKTAEDQPDSKKNCEQDSHNMTDTICSKQQQEENLIFPSLVVAAVPCSATSSTTTTARALVLPAVLSSSTPLLTSSSVTAAATICNAITTSPITSCAPFTTDASKKMTSSTTSDATVTGGRIVNSSSNSRRMTKKRKMGAAVPGTWSSCDNVPGSKVLEPSTHDVLKGRGEGLYNHEGNRFYRWIIKENAFAYQTATKRKMKSGTISEIYLTIQKRGGRFLILNEDLNLWYEMSEVEAKRKISQSLRDEKKKRNISVFKNASDAGVAIDDDEQNNEEYTKMLDNYEQAGSFSYLLPPPPPPLECGVTTSSGPEQARRISQGRREDRPVYHCAAPPSLIMSVQPLESSHSNIRQIRPHCNPSTYIDAPKNHDNKTTCTPMNNNAPAATNVTTLFEQSLSPLKFYYNLNTTSSRTSNRDEYSSFDVQEGPPMLLPAGPACQSMCPEGVKKGQRLDFTGSALLQQQEPSSLSENNIDSMKQEEQRSSKSTILLQDGDHQEESLRCPENAEMSTYRLFEEDESPSSTSNACQFVPNPHLLFLPPQQENEQQQQQLQLQQQDGVERSHSLSTFPSFGSTPIFIRQQEQHHDQPHNLPRRHSLEEESDDGFDIEGMVWEKDEY